MAAGIRERLSRFFGLGTPSVRPRHGAMFIAGGYALTAVAWLVVSGVLLWTQVVEGAKATVLVIINGSLFVVFTTTVLFLLVQGYLRRLREAEERFAAAQSELRNKDLAVRQGYVDVLDAVTGGKLILMTEDELKATLGEFVMPRRVLGEARDVSPVRAAVRDVIAPMPVPDDDAVVLAVSEALTNAVKHGGRGDCAVYRSGSCLQVVVRDFGRGIDFRQLPKAALVQGFSTTNTMGLGFTIMLEVCDRVLLATDKDGTTLVLEVALEPAKTPEQERSLATILAASAVEWNTSM